ncbi:MAG: hypothetical protein RLZZ609_1338 [Cyanobacteriota bacterium]|jgi:glycosyltransferase involved in cell wall biosynthesis
MTVTLYGWTEEVLKDQKKKRRNELDLSELKLSIVIPTLNQAGTIEDTLLSIIKQDYQNYEIIIMDGGSNDGTLNRLDNYRSYITYLVSETDKGQSNAINKGFELASGDIFAWINSDDYYLPGSFSKVVNTFRNYPNVDIVVGGGCIVNKNDRFLKHIDPMQVTRSNLLQWDNDKWIMQQSCFWTSSIWKRSLGVDEELDLLMDFDLWLRFSELGKSIMISDTLAVMRYYPEAKTVSQKIKMREELGYVYAKNGALTQVKNVIQELVRINKDLTSIIEERDRRLLTRLLKRFGFKL